MMISTRGRYALRLMVDLAERGQARFVTLRELAERLEISEKYLESIVKELVRAGFLEGLRGKGGGYRLARPAEQVSVLELLRVMEGSLAPVACLAEGAKPCERASRCRTLPLWQGLDAVIAEYLGGFTLLDLVKSEGDGCDYVI